MNSVFFHSAKLKASTNGNRAYNCFAYTRGFGLHFKKLCALGKAPLMQWCFQGLLQNFQPRCAGSVFWKCGKNIVLNDVMYFDAILCLSYVNISTVEYFLRYRY